MFVSRKEKSVTRASILVAYKKAQELGCVTGPRSGWEYLGQAICLSGVPEAGDYLAPVLVDFRPEKQDADAGVQPQHQDHDGGQAAVHIRIITEIVEVDGKSVQEHPIHPTVEISAPGSWRRISCRSSGQPGVQRDEKERRLSASARNVRRLIRQETRSVQAWESNGIAGAAGRKPNTIRTREKMHIRRKTMV